MVQEEASKKAINLMLLCSTDKGFLASNHNKTNYMRVWGRDSMICSLAALMTENKKLIKIVKNSLETLSKYQHEEGQIPSNVDLKGKDISYGGSAGRVDPIMWFVIVLSQYVKRTNDISFLKKHFSSAEKAMVLLKHYEFNNRNLLYIPQGGDWADEYLQRGYVLYDEVLYYLAKKEYFFLKKKMKKKVSKKEKKKLESIKKTIKYNFVINKNNFSSKWIYDTDLYEQALKKPISYFVSYFTPSFYSDKFDGFGNALALLSDIFSKKEKDSAKEYILKKFNENKKYLIPAFWPVVKEDNRDWQALKFNYKYKFHNKPYHYSNGGLWQVVTGFFAASLEKKNAEKYLRGVVNANSKKNWSFYEYFDSKEFKPRGTKHQCWSAAAQIIISKHLEGEKLFL